MCSDKLVFFLGGPASDYSFLHAGGGFILKGNSKNFSAVQCTGISYGSTDEF